MTAKIPALFIIHDKNDVVVGMFDDIVTNHRRNAAIGAYVRR